MNMVGVHEQDIQERVLSNVDGVVQMEVSWLRQAMEMSGPLGSSSFDSASGIAPTEAQFMVLNALAGQSFQVTLRNGGEEVAVTGVEEVQTSIINSLPAELGDVPRRAVAEAFNEETLASMIGQSLAMLPKEAVEVGGRWQHSQSLPIPGMGSGGLEMVGDYVLVEIQPSETGDLARMEGTFSASVTGSELEALGMSIEGTAVSVFNLDLGTMTRADSDVSVSLTAQGLPIVVTVHTGVTVDVTDAP
jgi:hypothetical protein